MAVDVYVPVGVRLRAHPTPAKLAELEVRTGDAVRRALDVVREEVLEPRGHGRPVHLVQEGVRFAGPPAPDGLHGVVERAVRRALDHAVWSSRLERWYEPGRTVEPPGGPLSEPFDPERMGAGGYLVPSYDGGGAPRSVVTIGEPTVYTLTVEDALEQAWEAHRTRFGALWDPATYGYPGYYGSFLADGSWLKNHLVYYAHVDAIDENGNPTTFRWQLGGFDMLSLTNDAPPDAGPTREPLTPPLDHYTLIRTDQTGTPDALEQLMSAAAAEDPDYPYDVAAIRRLAAAATQPSWPVYRIDGGPHVGFVVLPPGSDTEGIAHSPIHFIAPGLPTIGTQKAGAQGAGGTGTGGGTTQEEEDEGAGGGREGGRQGGRGKRGRGGPLGQAEGEGTLWPVPSTEGEPLVCEPFLGEPPVHTLAVGGDELQQRMRALADELELKFCGYAGQFCLNLARLIGARAHAVGAASARSTVRTEVTARSDGGGNNAFVDIRPGSAAELRYLQVLGDLAVQVDRFADLVRTTYERRENAHLIYWDSDHEYDPNPAAWSLRFLIAMHDTLEQGCMWLYAECCRVILLQQLRSAYDGITARQRQNLFTETLGRFQEALDILGESVVRLTVLERARSWGRRYSLTGPVRSVLSYRPPPRRVRDDYIEVSAPIESIASVIVTQLESATIAEEGGEYVAHYDGKRWTGTDLEQGMALRRGMLNRVDPLFLQVENLESVYTRSRGDPGYLRTFLTDLLAEMLRANQGTTGKTVDVDDGAFFALEASQYVKAKGGNNERGLEFDLQGIHALADDILRPYTDGTDAYRRGINLAIGRKAGWDDFVSLFASVGIVLLGILCAPLGAGVALLVTSAAGLAETALDVMEANRMEDIYHGLLDPEAILSWQDVQLQRFMANLSIAFSIFDVIGVVKGARAIIGSLRTGLRELAEQGLRGAARAAITAARAHLLRVMTEEVLENALKQAASELAVIEAMNVLLPRVMEPALVPWLRGVAVAHGTLAEVDAVLGPLAAGQPAPLPVHASVPEELLEGGGAEAAP